MTLHTFPTVEANASLMWERFMRGEFIQAQRLAKQVLVSRPKHARARSIQAVFAWREGDIKLGLDLCRAAVEADPNDVEAIKVAARQHLEAGLSAEAVRYYQMEHDLEGTLQSQMDLAFGLLCAERWAEGWTLHEARVAPELKVAHFSAFEPQWDGHLTMRALVLPEAGFGDAIQFARYNRALPPSSVVWTRKSLSRLLATTGVETHHAPLGTAPPKHSAWCFSMSLPHILSQPLPSGAPYLGTGVSPSPQVKRRSGRPAVGIAWGGSPLAPRDRLRSLSGEHLAKLFANDKVDWHILQQGPYLASLRPFAHLPHIHTYEVRDFLDTAEIMQALDLVISVDTSIVHLAGALGKPCWCILSTVPDFRYPGLSERTPWYDSVRLFRQSSASPGQWDVPITNVLAALESL